MSICRTTIVECHTEADADAVIADYNANFDSMFPECEMSINSRVNPTTIISNSVYANQEAIEKTGTGARKHLWKTQTQSFLKNSPAASFGTKTLIQFYYYIV